MEKLFPSPDKETQNMTHIGDALPKYKPVFVENCQSGSESTTTVETSTHIISTGVQIPARKFKGKYNSKGNCFSDSY